MNTATFHPGRAIRLQRIWKHGRNVWQHPNMEHLINAIWAIVREEESVQSAQKILR